MTIEIERGGFADSLSYLVFGDGDLATFEPFCEASLIAPYPHHTLADVRRGLDSPARVQLTAIKTDNALHSIWDVDGAVRVKGWRADVVEANQAIWSKRKNLASAAYWTGVVSTAGSALYSVCAGNVGTFFGNIGGDQVAQGVAMQAAKAAFASLGTAAGLGLLVAFVGGALLWYIASNRWSEANEKLQASQHPVCFDVANRRTEMLLGRLHEAVKYRGVYGAITKEGIIAPQECEWLWIESIKQERYAFENPLMHTGGELVSNFGRRNPFDVMDRALLTDHETNHALMSYVQGANVTYGPLIAQVRSVQMTYDTRANDIRRNAEHNRTLIKERRRMALKVVDSMYWRKVDGARRERDKKLSPLQPNVSNMTADEARRIQSAYNLDPRVKRIKEECRKQVSSYDSYRALAHSAIHGWFTPQLERENKNEIADLKANHQASLSHLSLFYPGVRALYSWTAGAIETFEYYNAGSAPVAYTQPAPSVPNIVAPAMPPLATAVEPEEPSNSAMRSWADVGSGLGLGLFVTAAAGVGLWAAYRSSQSEYDEVLQSHADESAPVLEFTEPAPPSYEEVMGYYSAPPVVPSAPPFEDVVAPPSYEEATRSSVVPSAPLAPEWLDIA